MKNIVIIGQSPAAYAALKDILDRDPSTAITLVSTDGELPYDPMTVPGLIDRSIKEADLFCAAENFYMSARVQLIRDKQVSRVNFDRKKVFLSDKVQLDFDALILTNTPDVKLPALKGIRRKGVFHLARLGVVKDLVRYLMNTETAIVDPSGFAGIKAALALKSVGKEVLVVAREGALLPGILVPERSQALAAALQKRGIRVLSEGCIEDIIGETEVKAVRFSSGKVVACDMVVIEEVLSDMSFVTETEAVLTDKLLVTTPSSASVIVAGIFGEEKVVAQADLLPKDMLGAFFHPEELVVETPEAAT